MDLTAGFCSQGPLASDRVAGIVKPVSMLFQRAFDLGARHFLLPQDTHTDDAVEFESVPPHRVRGTDESSTIGELLELPFSDSYVVFEKYSLSSSINTELDGWLAGHAGITTYVVVGDCTDLCVYLLAMHLRLRASARGLRDARVIVAIDGVNTYDLSVDVAGKVGAMPHDGDLLHLVFLSSMALNGVEIVERVV